MKKLLSILCATLAALTLFSFAACNTDINNSESDVNKTPPDIWGEGDPISHYTFADCYHLGDERYSFANLTVNSVMSDLFYSQSATQEAGLGWSHLTVTTSHYVVLECIVEEDFYERIDEGTIVYLPIMLDFTTYDFHQDDEPVKDEVPDETYQEFVFEESSIREFFCEGQRFIACFREEGAPRLKLSQTDEQYDFSHLTIDILLDDLIPISESKVNFSGLYQFLSNQGYRYSDYSERCEDYTDYITNGMTIEEVSENLRAFADGQK